jgi:hypothetical protein
MHHTKPCIKFKKLSNLLANSLDKAQRIALQQDNFWLEYSNKGPSDCTAVNTEKKMHPV